MKAALILAALALEGFGLLFLLQGAGLVRWPASSFMIDQTLWMVVGIGMMLVGSLLYVVAMRRRA